MACIFRSSCYFSFHFNKSLFLLCPFVPLRERKKSAAAAFLLSIYHFFEFEKNCKKMFDSPSWESTQFILLQFSVELFCFFCFNFSFPFVAKNKNKKTLTVGKIFGSLDVKQWQLWPNQIIKFLGIIELPNFVFEMLLSFSNYSACIMARLYKHHSAPRLPRIWRYL